jgi:hypothetical protein
MEKGGTLLGSVVCYQDGNGKVRNGSAALSRDQIVMSERTVQLWKEIQKEKMTLLRVPASSPWERE